MYPDRVVDVQFKEVGGYGSGYLLSDRLVLTARHVPSDIRLGMPCIVRGAKTLKIERAGTLVWVSEDPDHDAALVEIAPESAFVGLAPWTPEFGNCPHGDETRGHDPTYDCVAIGFPRAIRKANARQDWKLTGIARPVIVKDVIEIKIVGATLADELWNGFSGAALFCGKRLIGIIQSELRGSDGGVLFATPVSPLLRHNNEFRNLVAGPDARWETLVLDARRRDFQKEFRKHLGQLYCFIDRVPQVAQVQAALTHAAPRTSAHARGFLVDGTAHDAHSQFIERLGQHRPFLSLWGDVGPQVAIAQLPWPSYRIITNPQAEFNILKRECAALLKLDPGAEESAEAFRFALETAGGTRAVWWTVEQAGAVRGHGVLLDLWLGFCAEVSSGDAPLVWFACLVRDSAPDRRKGIWPFRRGAGSDPPVRKSLDRRVRDGSLFPLDTLGPVVLSDDLGPWLQLVASRRRDLGPSDTADLGREINDQVGGVPSIRLGPLIQAIRKSLEYLP